MQKNSQIYLYKYVPIQKKVYIKILQKNVTYMLKFAKKKLENKKAGGNMGKIFGYKVLKQLQELSAKVQK